MVRNSELESGESVAERLTDELENFRVFFESHNYVHFKVDVRHDKRRIDPDGDGVLDVIGGEWETQQWKNKASVIHFTIHR